MFWYLAMQTLPIGYGVAYIVHSFKRRRYRQAAAVAVLTGIAAGVSALLLWEFSSVP